MKSHKHRTKYARRKRDREYMAWISQQPCSIPHCRTRQKVEVAHVGDHAGFRKGSDRDTAPLCRPHHREGPEAYHRLGKRFWRHHGLERDRLIRELNRKYQCKF